MSQAILNLVGSIDGWLSPHEAYFLFSAVQENNGRGEVVEIGSWKGKSTICLAAGLKKVKKGKVTAIDPHKGKFTGGKASPTYKEFLENIKSVYLDNYVTPLVATSDEAAQKWKRKVKFLFIDGLHDYQHTHEDFSLWEKFVKKDGIIALHDAFCGHIGPEKVVLEEILPSNEYSSIGVVGSIIYVKKGSPHFFGKIIIEKSKLLIKISFALNKLHFPFKFFLIHRIIKFFLMNKYTLRLLLD